MDINFSNLGPIGISLLQDVTYRYLNKLLSQNTNTQIGCIIKINNISGNLNNNCKIIIENACFSNTKTAFVFLIDSLKEVLLLLDEDKKNNILNKLGLTIYDLDNKNNVGFIGTCSAYAILHNSININNFYLPNCGSSISDNYSTILFVNSGSVEANCGIAEISKGFIFENDNIINENKFIYSIAGLKLKNIFNFILYILIIILIFITVICLIIILNKKYQLKYYSKFKI